MSARLTFSFAITLTYDSPTHMPSLIRSLLPLSSTSVPFILNFILPLHGLAFYFYFIILISTSAELCCLRRLRRSDPALRQRSLSYFLTLNFYFLNLFFTRSDLFTRWNFLSSINSPSMSAILFFIAHKSPSCGFFLNLYFFLPNVTFFFCFYSS